MKAQTVQSADIDPGLKDSEVSPSSVTLDVKQKGCCRRGWKDPEIAQRHWSVIGSLRVRESRGEKLQGSELEGEDC